MFFSFGCSQWVLLGFTWYEWLRSCVCTYGITQDVWHHLWPLKRASNPPWPLFSLASSEYKCHPQAVVMLAVSCFPGLLVFPTFSTSLSTSQRTLEPRTPGSTTSAWGENTLRLALTLIINVIEVEVIARLLGVSLPLGSAAHLCWMLFCGNSCNTRSGHWTKPRHHPGLKWFLVNGKLF